MIPRILSQGGTIALLCTPEHQALREKISGVYTAATRNGWQVFQTPQQPTAQVIRKLKQMLNPIGFIVDSLLLSSPLSRKPFDTTPTVLLGRDNNRKKQIFDCSCQDSRQPVQAAVDILNKIDNIRGFAFIGHPSNVHWSRERGSFFREMTSLRGNFHEYSGPDAESDKGASVMKRWLRSLPKPCGLFLATDHLAASVFNAIHLAKLSVPNDLAVISVDDIQQICTNVSPTLTSVNVDFQKAGENAVELLKRRLKDPKRPLETLTYGVTMVSERASTHIPYKDPRVNRAVDFILNNVSAQISAVHVAREMGCCRRLAEQKFRTQTGKSILQAIHTARIEKAKSLLSCDSIPLSEIHSFCGYDSPAFFKMLFHRETGMSMRDWRETRSRNGKFK